MGLETRKGFLVVAYDVNSLFESMDVNNVLYTKYRTDNTS